MVILLAILLREPEAERFARAIASDPRRLVSAVSALETAIVIHARKGPAGVRELDLLIHAAGLTVVSLDSDQVLLARVRPARSTGRDIIPLVSTWGTAAVTPWLVPRPSPSCSRGMTSLGQMFLGSPPPPGGFSWQSVSSTSSPSASDRPARTPWGRCAPRGVSSGGWRRGASWRGPRGCAAIST